MDKINALIAELKELADKLKVSIDTDKRDDYEYKLFYLNSDIGDYEQQYEEAQQILDDLYDKKYIELRPSLKSDKAAEKETNQSLKTELTDMSIRKSQVKRFNRVHKGMIRLGDYINGKQIQINYDKKQATF
jgi:hypothetical protein